jgi:predicted Zn finger-like uncharacterized protein
MFVTECPDCHAKFRVTDGQLRLADGRVRCGNCLSIFDAHNGRADRPAVTAIDHSKEHSTGLQFAQLDAEPIVLERFNTQPESPFKTALMILILLLCATLSALQYLWFERAKLNAHPSLRPLYILLCSQIDCDLSAKEGLALLTIEQTLVRDHPRYSNALEVTLKINNQSTLYQPYPAVELSLKDLQGRLISRRTFDPNEYLELGINPERLSPKLPVQIQLTLTKPDEAIASFEANLSEARFSQR